MIDFLFSNKKNEVDGYLLSWPIVFSFSLFNNSFSISELKVFKTISLIIKFLLYLKLYRCSYDFLVASIIFENKLDVLYLLIRK